jgi:hypothetical protein
MQGTPNTLPTPAPAPTGWLSTLDSGSSSFVALTPTLTTSPTTTCTESAPSVGAGAVCRNSQPTSGDCFYLQPSVAPSSLVFWTQSLITAQPSALSLSVLAMGDATSSMAIGTNGDAAFSLVGQGSPSTCYQAQVQVPSAALSSNAPTASYTGTRATVLSGSVDQWFTSVPSPVPSPAPYTFPGVGNTLHWGSPTNKPTPYWMTFTPSPTAGDTITINTPGTYWVQLRWHNSPSPSANAMFVSRNVPSPVPVTIPTLAPYAQVLYVLGMDNAAGGATNPGFSSVSYLLAGDVLRSHVLLNANLAGQAATLQWAVARIGCAGNAYTEQMYGSIHVAAPTGGGLLWTSSSVTPSPANVDNSGATLTPTPTGDYFLIPSLGLWSIAFSFPSSVTFQQVIAVNQARAPVPTPTITSACNPSASLTSNQILASRYHTPGPSGTAGAGRASSLNYVGVLEANDQVFLMACTPPTNGPSGATGGGYRIQKVAAVTEESAVPSRAPSKAPSRAPSKAPSRAPSRAPSLAPATSAPSGAPSTSKPSRTPSRAPSRTPTGSPSKSPFQFPSGSPTTSAPSRTPSHAPSVGPSTSKPSRAPSKAPSRAPSKAPSRAPSHAPSKAPSRATSHAPSHAPTTTRPSRGPSAAPTDSCYRKIV